MSNTKGQHGGLRYDRLINSRISRTGSAAEGLSDPNMGQISTNFTIAACVFQPGKKSYALEKIAESRRSVGTSSQWARACFYKSTLGTSEILFLFRDVHPLSRWRFIPFSPMNFIKTPGVKGLKSSESSAALVASMVEAVAIFAALHTWYRENPRQSSLWNKFLHSLLVKVQGCVLKLLIMRKITMKSAKAALGGINEIWCVNSTVYW